MSPAELRSQLLEFINAEVAVRPLEGALVADFPIIESGLVDSLGLFKVVAYLEESLGVEISPEDIVLENFVTVEAIVALSARYRKADG